MCLSSSVNCELLKISDYLHSFVCSAPGTLFQWHSFSCQRRKTKNSLFLNLKCFPQVTEAANLSSNNVGGKSCTLYFTQLLLSKSKITPERPSVLPIATSEKCLLLDQKHGMGEREVSVSLLVFFIMNNSNIDVCKEDINKLPVPDIVFGTVQQSRIYAVLMTSFFSP